MESWLERQRSLINIHRVSLRYWMAATWRQHGVSNIHELKLRHSINIESAIEIISHAHPDNSGEALHESTYCMPYFHCLYTAFLSFSPGEAIILQLYANS